MGLLPNELIDRSQFPYDQRSVWSQYPCSRHDGVLEESKKVSPLNAVGDTENQALQRFLARAKVEQKVKTFAIVKIYQPNGRKTEYFRLDYRVGKKTKSIHIPGGNIRAKLAQDRATEIQTMIDRGAQLMELMAMIESYRT